MATVGVPWPHLLLCFNKTVAASTAAAAAPTAAKQLLPDVSTVPVTEDDVVRLFAGTAPSFLTN
jgi:hypothetical protein